MSSLSLTQRNKKNTNIPMTLPLQNNAKNFRIKNLIMVNEVAVVACIPNLINRQITYTPALLKTFLEVIILAIVQ